MKIIIAGAGELLEEVTTQSESESLPIKFLGWRNDIDLILSASDIAVLAKRIDRQASSRSSTISGTAKLVSSATRRFRCQTEKPRLRVSRRLS